jgi:hypothetical protein
MAVTETALPEPASSRNAPPPIQTIFGLPILAPIRDCGMSTGYSAYFRKVPFCPAMTDLVRATLAPLTTVYTSSTLVVRSLRRRPQVNVDHLALHSVELDEAEAVLDSAPLVLRRCCAQAMASI